MSNAKILAGTVSTGGVLATGQVSATQVTGTLPIANGGTGATTAPGALTALSAAALGANTFTAAQEWASGTAIASASSYRRLRSLLN